MEAVFLKLLNMSITASYLVLAVILARVLLKKAPKFITVILWGLVAVRLVCPFSIESVFSLIPSSETVPADIMYAKNPQIYSGISSVNTAVNNIILPAVAPDTTYSANPLQIIVTIVSVMWLVGIAVMLLYTLISYIRIRFKVREAVKLQDNIYECDRIATPFILGIIKPRIYLPSDMDECDREYVIAHERAHLARRDHIWKPLGFLLLAVYWFNPVLWLGYILLCRDIELACDEKVIKQLGTDNKKPYSQALINCSAPRRAIAACPLAFGETGVKGRIKSVLNYKKPALWIIIISVALSIAVAVCFMTNPSGKKITDIPDNFVFGDTMFDDIDELTVMTYETGYTVSYSPDVEKIIGQLEKLRVRKDEISKSRSEDRDKTNSIIFETYTLYFNEDFTEIWGIDGLKPSFSHKVLNPTAAEKAFELAAKNGKSNFTADNMTYSNMTYGCDANGVSVTVKAYDFISNKPYIEIEFTNEWDNEIIKLGPDFDVLYFKDGEYISCATENIDFSGYAYDGIKSKSSKTMRYDLSGFDLTKTGKYRFEAAMAVWVEFELKNQNEGIDNIRLSLGDTQPTSVADSEGLSLSVKHLALYDDNPYIEVGFNNESGSEYTFGEKFELYYKQDGEYVSCYVLSDNPNVKRVIADVANIISPHGSRTHKFYLSWFDLSKEGTYKFEIEVSDVKASVEFELE